MCVTLYCGPTSCLRASESLWTVALAALRSASLALLLTASRGLALCQMIACTCSWHRCIVLCSCHSQNGVRSRATDMRHGAACLQVPKGMLLVRVVEASHVPWLDW